MIAIDTNVLLRYLLDDDPKQSNKAKALISTQSPVLISDIVLVETVWTLTGKRYQLGKEAICQVVRGLIGDSSFIFESSQVVWSALNDYEHSVQIRGKSLDFPDALIANKVTYLAQAQGQAFHGFYSFDKAVAQLAEAKQP